MDSTSTPRDDGLLSRVTALESKIAQLEAARVEPATPKDVEKAVEEAKRYRTTEWFQQYGTSPVQAWYLAGQNGCGGLSTMTITADTIYAIPRESGKGGRLNTAAFRLTGGNAAGRKARIAVFSNTSDSELYPYQLVCDFGEQDCSSAGVKSTASNVVLEEDTLYWWAIVGNNSSLTVRSMVRDDVFPCYGLDSAFGTSAGWGLTVSFTYAAFTQNFPGGAAIATGADVPAIGYRLEG